jgi:hypothetical protein
MFIASGSLLNKIMTPQITYIAISPNDLDRLVNQAARAIVKEREEVGITKEAACKRWNISRDSFDRLMKEGRIKPYTPGGTQLTRYRIAELDKIFEPEK